MPVTKTIEFLPAIFQTDANKKFLNATLDQLVNEPSLVRINGYIGRKFAPAHKSTDRYLREPSPDRGNYQLEPSVVVKDKSTNEVEFHVTYPELLQKIGYYGGKTANQNSLWANDYYSFNPHVDLDKFVNFNEYYWLPDGPDAIDVFAGSVDLERDFQITTDSKTNAYNFSGFFDVPNPDIVLARGGTYKFVVDQPGRPFWIQTTPGLSGMQEIYANYSSRDILGVENNGTESGTVTFTVPSATAQDFYINLPKAQDVDLVSHLSYTQLQNKLLSQIVSEHGGIDGISLNLNNKTLVFAQLGDDGDWVAGGWDQTGYDRIRFDEPYTVPKIDRYGEPYWTPGGLFDTDDAGYDATMFDQGTPVPIEQRYGVWRLSLISVNDGSDYLVQLTHSNDIAVNYKIGVKTGVKFGGTEWYKGVNLVIEQIPIITSNLNVLYYQDGVNDYQVGIIRLVDPTNNNIDVDSDILGKAAYVSPNGVMFSNGMKVRFDSQVVPSSYADKEYYVEGVGTSISLTAVTDIAPPADFDIETPDYMLVNRSSLERSPWAWSNRWFHKDIVNLTAHYNRTIPDLSLYANARRPIVEFEPNLQLFDFGSKGKTPVDVFDMTITEPFAVVENSLGFWVDGVELKEGSRVIFANDQDPATRNNIWVVNFVNVDNTLPRIHLTMAADGEINTGDTVLVRTGAKHANKNYWFNGLVWDEGQTKTFKNQPPLFDVYDQDNNSFGDKSVYPVAKVSRFFQGCKIFAYGVGTGASDPILGFPLAYKNLNNVGDIKFINHFDTDSFDYTIDKVNYTTKINTGMLRKNNADGTYTRHNVWTKVVEPSKQYQNLSFTYDGIIDLFFVDVLPNYEYNVPSLLVYVNHNKINGNQYKLSGVPGRDGFNMVISREIIKAGDKIDVLVYSDSVSKTGSYQVPKNLDLNAQNKNFTDLTLGNMRTHVNTLVVNSLRFVGFYPGNSNLRDLSVTAQGGSILQQSAPVPYSAMFLADEQANFIDSTLFASQEYTRFKIKFLESALKIDGVDYRDPVAAVDMVIKNINIAKNKSFPWFYSDMIPYGDNKVTNAYTVYNPEIREYEISSIFDNTKLSNNAVLVYHNGVQLIKERDYKFSSSAAVVVIQDSVTLEVNDQLLVVEYVNTDGCYVPETPTKMGLYPSFTPYVYVDRSFRPIQIEYIAQENQTDFPVQPWHSVIADSDIQVEVQGEPVEFTVTKATVRNPVYKVVTAMPISKGLTVTVKVPHVMICGHDGSRTPAFGDFRDDMLLELEKRIHNNIKISYDETKFNLYSVMPGKFRNTGYTLQEYTAVLSTSFLNWAGANRLIYSDNDSWSLTDEFSWNYRRYNDTLDGELLPGSWKACYQYFYDTHRPNTHPWEMLGFSDRPDWWEARYGAAPYTGGNLVMWQDLANGYIAGGPRQGVDTRFARPDLLKIIPVDAFGNLKPPAGLLAAEYINAQSNSSWAFGNMGPVEMAWRNSSDYPYAVQRAMALTKPGQYFGLMINTQQYVYNAELTQYLNVNTAQRMTQDDIIVNGSIDDNGGIQRAAGYLNWIAGYLTNMGIDPTVKLEHYIRDFEVQLSYRMAGYSDKNKLKVFAEQNSPNSTSDSILVPDSDYDLILNKSTPLRKAVYSAVIVERTQTGYRVSGYDTTNPIFNVIPPIVDTVGSHTIEVLNRRVTVYNQFNKFKVTVPYGYEFENEQQLANFISGYGLYLASQGFKFDLYDSELQEIRNWSLSIKEFLFWAQQGWSANSVIVLSPASNTVNMMITNAIVDGVSDSVYGSKIKNQNFEIIKNNAYSVVRDRNQFSISVNSQEAICYAEFDVVQYEHVMIFNNQTMFNDTIYQPESGSRQHRLKLVGFKTSNWTGNLDPRGFIYNNGKVDVWQAHKDYLKGDLVSYKGFYYTASKDLTGATDFGYNDWKRLDTKNFKTGLLNNFATNSTQSENFYNVDGINLESQFDLFGKALIGYKSRDYLAQLGVDDTSQVKFYQGFIKDKGTRNALNAMSSVSFNNVDTNINISEEWAFRVGEYGALDTNRFVEVQLTDSLTLPDPFSVEINNKNSVADMSVMTPYRVSNIDAIGPIFLSRSESSDYSSDISTAGFAQLDEVDYTLFDINDLNDLNTNLSDIGSGTTIWCAKGIDSSWNVFRASDTSVKVLTISNALDGLITLTTDKRHDLKVNDFIAVKDAGRFTGFYKVKLIQTLKSFVVEYTKDLVGFVDADYDATLLKLTGIKFDYASGLGKYTPTGGWKAGERVWIESDNNGWSVYEKLDSWQMNNMLPIGTFAEGEGFGSSVCLSPDAKTALVGKPAGAGKITSYITNYQGVMVEDISITSNVPDTYALGAAMRQGSEYTAIGAPNSSSSRGYVFVAKRYENGQVAFTQVVTAPEDIITSVNAQFGHAVAISRDDQWLYVGAPGANAVYAYAYSTNSPVYGVKEIYTDGLDDTFTLPFAPESDDSVTVDFVTEAGSTIRYAAHIDYTIQLSPAQITFRTAPPIGTLLVSQTPGYRFVAKIAGETGTLFGFSIATTTDGAQVAVGAPAYNNESGQIKVYDRSIEAFNAVSDQTSFKAIRPISNISKVLVNGIIKTPGTDYDIVQGTNSIKFITSPNISDVVSIETNEFQLLSSIEPSAPVARSQFGYSLDICTNNCSLYVGSPNYNDGHFNSGGVYRFLNQGRVYGTIIGTVRNPVVTTGNSIRINDYEIVFDHSDLDSVVNDINVAKIPGVVAVNADGYLRLTSNSTIATKRIRILPGQGNTIQELGLTVFPEIQFITHPMSDVNEFFGKAVRIGDDAKTLLVGTEYGTTFTTTTFDDNTTLFDAGSTYYREAVTGSGAVYVFNSFGDSRNDIEHPSQFAYVQQLVPNNAAADRADLFGHALDLRGNRILVGAPADEAMLSAQAMTVGSSYTIVTAGTTDFTLCGATSNTPGTVFIASSVPNGNGVVSVSSGQVYAFDNATGSLGWNVVRQETSKVDIDCINRFYMYSASQNLILESLDYIDPAKGKILGEAEQEIRYKTSYDPAVYNQGNSSSVSINKLRHWSEKQLGQVWWDLSTVRYVDYEQGSVTYRTSNWGKTFPGSEINVYEWVESIYLPSEYVAAVGDGTPLYPDDSAYVTLEYTDPATNGIYKKYFYWVKDRATVDQNMFGRNIPVLSVKKLIENPKGQGIKFAAAISANAVALFNTNDLISGTDTVLHIDYDSKINADVIHSEWELISENASSVSKIPRKVYNKIIDSLAGADSAGNIVPDPLLPVQDRYGIENRPRQSVFLNREGAVKILVERVNAFFKDVVAAEVFDLASLTQEEPIPAEYSGAWDASVPNIETLGYLSMPIQPVGHKVLVVNDSTVNNLWSIYTKTVRNTWALTRVQSYKTAEYWEYIDWYAPGFDQYTIPNYVVNTMRDLETMIFKSGDIVKIKNDGNGRFRLIRITQASMEVIGVQHGTIKLKTALYDLSTSNLGYGNDNFDTARFDQNTSIELRLICDALANDILVGQYEKEFTNVFFAILNYILTEQKYVDWMFKTSFVSVLHKLRKLNQPAVMIKDNQDYYLDYINEVKPFHTTIREYVVQYDGVDNYQGYVTDFDVPAYYDQNLNLFRSPSGEYPQDLDALQAVSYRDWDIARKYSVESIGVVNGGSGYVLAPKVTITGSLTGYDAQATALVSGGKVVSIIVTNPGHGYLGQPTITLTGGGGVGATAYAKLKQVVKTYDALTGQPAQPYNLVRSMTTSLVFDRITYKSNVKTWQPNTVYETHTVSNIEWWSLLNNPSYFVADRTVATMAELYTLPFEGSEVIVKVLDDGNGRTRLVKLSKVVVAHKGIAYTVDRRFTSGEVFDANDLTEYNVSNFETGNDRVQAYYNPGVGLPGQALDLVQNGILYPGVNVTGPLFAETPFFDSMAFDAVSFDSFQRNADGTIELNQATLDTIIQSHYADVALGSRPEDIIVDGGGDVVNGNVSVNDYKPVTFTGGGGFVNSFSSHAPEELIPGIVFDTMDLKIHQTSTPDLTLSDPNIQGVTIQYVSYKVTKPLDTYSFDLGLVYNDVLFVYSRFAGPLADGVDYTVDYVNKTFTLTKNLATDDVVYLYLFNQVGASKINEVVYVADGSTAKFSTAVPVTLFGSALVLVNGVRTFDFFVETTNTVNANLVFDNTPPEGAYIHILSFDIIEIQPFSEIHRQSLTVVTPNPSAYDYAVVFDRPVFTMGPFDSQMVVEVNKKRLRSSTCAYYQADGTTVAFAGPSTAADINAATIIDTDVEVYVNGVLQPQGTSYFVAASSVGAPTITFVTAPAAKSYVIVAVTKFAEFRVLGSGLSMIIPPSTGLKEGDSIVVTSFANHDSLGIKTRTFVGAQEATFNVDVGFDYGGFADIDFDAVVTVSLLVPEFEIGTNFENIDYLWVTVNGRRLMPYYDFVIDGTVLKLSDTVQVTNSDVITITDFGSTPQPNPISWRVFKDMTGKVEYLRMAVENTTTLLADLAITDTVILVKNPEALPYPRYTKGIPGVVFIDGERITYYRNYALDPVLSWEPNTDYKPQTLVSYQGETYDVVGSANGADFSSIVGNLRKLSATEAAHGLGQLRRGTGGTGAPGDSIRARNHLAGTLVVDASVQQTIPKAASPVEEARGAVVDGATTEFVFTNLRITDPDVAVSSSPVEVYVNGRLADLTEYHLVSTNPITVSFITAPAKNSVIRVKIKERIWYNQEILRFDGEVFDSDPFDESYATNELGLVSSTTTQARFLKAKSGFLP